MAYTALPTGTVTFLFTDIEGSTKLWEQHPEAMKSALAKHDSILKKTIESNHGNIIKTTGDGFHAVFTTALDGINAAIAAQFLGHQGKRCPVNEGRPRQPVLRLLPQHGVEPFASRH